LPCFRIHDVVDYELRIPEESMKLDVALASWRADRHGDGTMRSAAGVLMPLIVGQDGILPRRLATAPGACVRAGSGRVTNPPQVQTAPQLPSNFRFRETMWRHWSIKRGGSIYEESAVVLLMPPLTGRLRYGRWYAKPAPATPTERKPLYWVDPKCIPGIVR